MTWLYLNLTNFTSVFHMVFVQKKITIKKGKKILDTYPNFMQKRVLRVFDFTVMRKRVLLGMYLKQDFRKIRNGWTHKQQIKFEWRKMFIQLRTIFCSNVFFCESWFLKNMVVLSDIRFYPSLEIIAWIYNFIKVKFF